MKVVFFGFKDFCNLPEVIEVGAITIYMMVWEIAKKATRSKVDKPLP